MHFSRCQIFFKLTTFFNKTLIYISTIFLAIMFFFIVFKKLTKISGVLGLSLIRSVLFTSHMFSRLLKPSLAKCKFFLHILSDLLRCHVSASLTRWSKIVSLSKRIIESIHAPSYSFWCKLSSPLSEAWLRFGLLVNWLHQKLLWHE